MKNTRLNDNFFSRLETLSLNLRSSLTGYFGGKHLVNTYGQTVEFADFREYQLGDDIRRIDWNLYSRFEKFFLKLFTDERQMNVQIFVDFSASMGRDDANKASYTTAAAAALGFLAVQNMDRVGFYLMRGDKAENPYGSIVGKPAFFRAVSSLSEETFDGDVDMEKCITGCPDVTVNNGLTVIVSDFYTESDWKKAVDFLCYKKRQVLLIQILTPEEADPMYDGRVNLIDSESVDVSDSKNLKIRITKSLLDSYKRAFDDYMEDMREFCKKRDVGFVSLRTNEPIERVLFGDLLKVGIMS